MLGQMRIEKYSSQSRILTIKSSNAKHYYTNNRKKSNLSDTYPNDTRSTQKSETRAKKLHLIMLTPPSRNTARSRVE